MAIPERFYDRLQKSDDILCTISRLSVNPAINEILAHFAILSAFGFFS